MRTRRKRMYLTDPRYRNQRSYAYVTRRHNGFTAVNDLGHSRAVIVGHGYASTPAVSRVRARKTVYRREPRQTKNARDMADERRYSRYVHEKFERMRHLPADARQSIKRKLDCEHEYRDTHPQSQWAYACDKCGIKGGIKPGRPDLLRDYF